MTTCNPLSHIVDSSFYSGGYTTSEARQVFCDMRRYQRWLDVEAALAMAMAKLDMISVAAAENIQQNAQISLFNLDEIRAALKLTNHSLMPLLAALRNACDKESGQFIHFGATTQDIQDTAQVLELRDIIAIVERDLRSIIGLLIQRTEQHQDLVMIGRTHCQHALPTTMGLKMAGWLDETWRNFERLQAMKKQVLVSQLFGGVGTMDAFGEKALPLLAEFSARLGLEAPMVAWHAARDRFTEYLSVLAMICGSMARIADEIRCLARNETGEMEEPFHLGKIGSSTMPHKRNPELCEQVVVLSKLVKAQAMLGFDGLLCEHERDYRSVRLEWAALTDASLYTCGLLVMMQHILADMTVHEERVRENVLRAAPLISSEALMFFIGTKIGKENAHALIYKVAMEAAESRRPVLDLLMRQPEVAGAFQREEIEQAISPEKHIGMAKELSSRTVALIQEKMRMLGDAPTGRSQSCPLCAAAGCRMRGC